MRVVVPYDVYAYANPFHLSQLVALLQQQTFSDVVCLRRSGWDLDIKTPHMDGMVIARINDLQPAVQSWIVDALLERTFASMRARWERAFALAT